MVTRSYNVPLRKGYMNYPNWKRTNKAVSTLRIFLQKHTKREDVRLGAHLNQHLWKHGIKNPPHHVKVDVWIEDEYARAELSGMEFKGAVKAEKKQEEGGLKDKLAKKIGVEKESKDDKQAKSEEKAEKEVKDDEKKSNDKKTPKKGRPEPGKETKPDKAPAKK